MVGVTVAVLNGPQIKALYEAVANAYTDTKNTKLAGIAALATKYPDTGEQAFLDADHTKLNGVAVGAQVNVGDEFTSTLHTKLNGIEALATKYPDTGEQAFLDADHSKLNGIEALATKYPDTGEQAFLDADHTKLDGVAVGATKRVINHGAYLGNGSAGKAITHGLGVVPTLILIVSLETAGNYFRIFGQENYIYCLTSSAGERLAVTAPTSTYFYVGNASDYTESANNNGDDYAWFAMG